VSLLATQASGYASVLPGLPEDAGHAHWICNDPSLGQRFTEGWLLLGGLARIASQSNLARWVARCFACALAGFGGIVGGPRPTD